MTADELMSKLQGLFPASFATRDALLAWTEVARTALGSYQGGTLQRAYDRVLGDWRHGYAPKPADFVAACQEVRANIHRPTASTPQFRNGADRAASIRGEKNRLIESWLSDNVHWLDDWIATNFAPAEWEIARSRVSWMIEPKAMAAAQGAKCPVEITPDELEAIKRRVASHNRGILGPEMTVRVSPYLRDGPPAREIIEEAS
jgi:hypothetical protein